MPARAQRVYKPTSVLGSGTWVKISVADEGIHQLDAAFLQSLGLGTNIPSAQLRVFGGQPGMLPEAASASRVDDLEELAIAVEDGGDGVLNTNDYALFYSPGPHPWIKDSAARRFIHQKNLYTDRAFYFITVGGVGKRIATQTAPPVAATTVTGFDERWAYELDSLNFLASGKEWYGDEFSALPGRSLSKTFALPLTNLLPGTATLNTSVISRSIAPSAFNFSVNGQAVQSLIVPAISSGQYEVFAKTSGIATAFNLSSTTVSVGISYTPNGVNSQGWLNWFEFFCRRGLVLPAARQLPFRDWTSVGGAAAGFAVSGPPTAQVWEVTDAFNPVRMATTATANGVRFTNGAARLREYVAFGNAFFTPKAEGRVAPQNLHASVASDYLIITPPEFAAQAQRVADFHRQRAGLVCTVVSTTQVFNEFSGGTPDPTALRDFVKLHFDRYRSTWNSRGKYLLLFGRASVDYKNRLAANTNLVPGYESPSSLDPLSTYTSDDFFGFLEDAEDINSGAVINTLDIGIGRIPARTAAEAKAFVDKLIDYHSPAAFGPWRSTLNFIADDEDNNLHLQDAETLTATATTTAPVFNQQKVYLDAYRQESGSAGGRYPQANVAVNSNIFNGTLLWNYSGHGGPQRLAEEVVIDQGIVNGWSNQLKLPLFITATCDFAPFDQPGVASLGENLLVRPKTGAIALMTTTRLVFAASNRIMNNNYLQTALQRDASGRYKTLGEAVQASKNLTYTTSGDITNNRKFTLLGDPAMTLAFPTLNVQATKVNGRDIASQTDTLSATEFITIEGEVRDGAGSLQSGFNGTAYLSLLDKPRSITTLGNDAGSPPTTFTNQSTVLFRGKAAASSGRFSFQFRLPKDINFQYGPGKVSLYAQDGTKDGQGFSTNLIIGGVDGGGTADTEGPVIEAFLNDNRFVNGGLTNANPVLLLNLSDSSGINTGSSGIDHDIVATLDGDNNRYFILNSFYESDLNSYQRGSLRFQLPALAPGRHTLAIKAWDVFNNSSEYLLEFTVAANEELRLERVLNYPNPFTTHTAFWFEHNYPGQDLRARVDIFTVSGRRIKSVNKTINTLGNRSIELEWDGLDEWGTKVGRGVYLYRLQVTAPNGKTTGKWERMALL